jgi:hypothetical protein
MASTMMCLAAWLVPLLKSTARMKLSIWHSSTLRCARRVFWCPVQTPMALTDCRHCATFLCGCPKSMSEDLQLQFCHQRMLCEAQGAPCWSLQSLIHPMAQFPPVRNAPTLQQHLRTVNSNVDTKDLVHVGIFVRRHTRYAAIDHDPFVRPPRRGLFIAHDMHRQLGTHYCPPLEYLSSPPARTSSAFTSALGPGPAT